MNITSTLSASGYAPSQPIPSDSIETIFDGSNYKCAVPAEFFSASPTSSKIVNVFSGSKIVDRSQYSVHASGFGAGGRVDAVSSPYVRSHDWYSPELNKNMRWRNIETSKGVFDWAASDAFVNSVHAAGKTVVWVLGPCTPAWASARPTEANVYGLPGMAAEPANMQDWSDFCAALVTRYGNKISHYQIWNEFDLANTFSGTNANMAMMTRLASQSIKAVNPDAKIVGPSISTVTTASDGGPAVQKMLSYFSTSDGSGGTALQWLDIVAVHMYAPSWIVSNWYQIPTQWARVAGNVIPAIGPRTIWDSEMGMISVNLLTSGTTGDVYLARRMLLNAIIGVSHSCFYDIYSGTDGLALDKDGSLVETWESVLDVLDSGPITVANIINNEKLAITINGVNYLF